MESIGTILEQYKAIIDERERLAETEKQLNKRKSELEGMILQHAEATGLTNFANDFISVTVSDASRAKYDPDLWESLVKWCVESANIGLLYRQLSVAKIEALVAEGVPLPAGLGLDPYKKLSYRRK